MHFCSPNSVLLLRFLSCGWIQKRKWTNELLHFVDSRGSCAGIVVGRRRRCIQREQALAVLVLCAHWRGRVYYNPNNRGHVRLLDEEAQDVLRFISAANNCDSLADIAGGVHLVPCGSLHAQRAGVLGRFFERGAIQGSKRIPSGLEATRAGFWNYDRRFEAISDTRRRIHQVVDHPLVAHFWRACLLLHVLLLLPHQRQKAHRQKRIN